MTLKVVKNRMRYWYGYTGESLILGHGRTIRQLVPPSQALQRVLDVASEHYARYIAAAGGRTESADAETFTAAIFAPLAIQEFGISSPAATPFFSVGQVLRLFGALSVDQVAINLFNGRMTSAYAEADPEAIAARVAQGFDTGDLLLLPRDATRLQTQEILNSLPGALVFLLSRSHAERKAFSDYLRHGKPPMLSADTQRALAKSRPILRTWEGEARRLKAAEKI